jgi:hypothetical protein
MRPTGDLKPVTSFYEHISGDNFYTRLRSVVISAAMMHSFGMRHHVTWYISRAAWLGEGGGGLGCD